MADILAIMDSIFKFKVGQLVTPTAPFEHITQQKKMAEIILEKDLKSIKFRTPPLIQIVERFAQQCHGGVQLFYKGRIYGAINKEFGFSDYAQPFMEFELMPYPEYEKIPQKSEEPQ